MTTYDTATIERVIEEVTREVLARLGPGASTASKPDGCNCSDGSCVAHCADKVGRVVSVSYTHLDVYKRQHIGFSYPG